MGSMSFAIVLSPGGITEIERVARQSSDRLSLIEGRVLEPPRRHANWRPPWNAAKSSLMSPSENAVPSTFLPAARRRGSGNTYESARHGHRRGANTGPAIDRHQGPS